jgi:DNA-binding NarL/FixJ family response regulator
MCELEPILTGREAEVAKLVFDGLVNKEIALRLGIAEQTTKNHITVICRKFNVRSSRGIPKKLLQHDYVSYFDYKTA